MIVLDDALAVMRDMATDSVDLVLTDPPYGKGRDRGTNGFGAARVRRYDGKPRWDTHTPTPEVFAEILRVGRNAVIFGGNHFAHMLPPSNHWIVWDKVGAVPFNNPFADCELVWTTFRRPIRKLTFIQQGFIRDSKDARYHPTQKPSELVAQLVAEYTEPGASVFDPFMGSGTTAVACARTGRSVSGCEIDPEYHAIAQQRYADALKEGPND